MMMIPEPRKGGAEVTVVVAVDDTPPETFTADSTTTGDSTTVAGKLLFAVEADVDSRLASRSRDERAGCDDRPAPTKVRRCAMVTVTVTAGEHNRTIASDTTTVGNVWRAAAALSEAACQELRGWLHTVYA